MKDKLTHYWLGVSAETNACGCNISPVKNVLRNIYAFITEQNSVDTMTEKNVGKCPNRKCTKEEIQLKICIQNFWKNQRNVS